MALAGAEGINIGWLLRIPEESVNLLQKVSAESEPGLCFIIRSKRSQHAERFGKEHLLGTEGAVTVKICPVNKNPVALPANEEAVFITL